LRDGRIGTMRSCFCLRTRARQIGWLLVPVLLVSVWGCGSNNTATVTGKVTFKGQPLRCGSVVFRSVEKRNHTGMIGTDGVYTAINVPMGKMRVAVISRDPSKTPPDTKKGATAPAPVEGWFPVPSKYETAGGGDLNCDVDAPQVTYNIELKE
jgi:hypothetical protein